jgi:hypothetical protein
MRTAAPFLGVVRKQVNASREMARNLPNLIASRDDGDGADNHIWRCSGEMQPAKMRLPNTPVPEVSATVDHLRSPREMVVRTSLSLPK